MSHIDRKDGSKGTYPVKTGLCAVGSTDCRINGTYAKQNIREYDGELEGKSHRARIGLRQLERAGAKPYRHVPDALRYIFPEPSMHMHIQKRSMATNHHR